MLQIIKDAGLLLRDRGFRTLNKLVATLQEEYPRFTNIDINDDCCTITSGRVRYDDKYAVFVSILRLGKGC